MEILTEFETGNRYSVLDERGEGLLYAYEAKSNFISKQLLGKHRNVIIHLVDHKKDEVLLIQRPYYFFKSSATVKFSSGQVLGYVTQRKWLVTKQFDFLNTENKTLFSCIAKPPHIWTFKIFMNGQQVAQILKKWSGYGKEFFTDADTFSVDFGNISDQSLNYAILATAFLIDLRVFEKKS